MSADLVARVRAALSDIERRGAACRELDADRERHGDNDLARIARAKATAYENAAAILHAALEDR